MPANPYIVGVVREIRGTSVKIRMLDNSSQLVYFQDGERYAGIVIGSYIGIKRGHYTIVAKVEREYAEDTLQDPSNQEFSKNRFIRELDAKVIGSFVGHTYQSGMVAFPQIFNDVVLLPSRLIDLILRSDEANKSKNSYFTIGKLWPDGIPYQLNWANLFNTHIAIFGNTGSGKSNTLTKLYTSLFDLSAENKISFGDSRFVFIDFNGEYVGDKVLSTNKKVIKLNTQTAEDTIAIPASKFWDVEMLSVLFGATAQTQKPFLSRILKYYFNEEYPFEQYLPTRIAKAFTEVFASPSDQALRLFRETLLRYLDINAADLSEWLKHDIDFNSTTSSYVHTTKIDSWQPAKNGNYYWNGTNDKAALHDVETQIKEKLDEIFSDSKKVPQDAMTQLKIAVHLQMIFDLQNHTIQYDHIAPLLHRIDANSDSFGKVLKIVDDKFHISTPNIQVVSLKECNRETKLLIPMIIAKISYDNHKSLKIGDDNTSIFCLVIDEAHNILSEKSSVESEKWKDYRLDVFEEIIKEGRKFGYYLTIASQRPSDISPTIVSQIHNYFIHRLVNENDLWMLDKTMSTLDSVSKGNIPNLAPGQAILTGSSFSLPVIVQIDKLPQDKSPNSKNSDLLKIWGKKQQ